MSKMPAKKKSCFQITSVTQAQVAASSVTDDTESLDDPDESRTEDVSSEIFDVSRADLGVCERSSSEETLNNVGESQEGQPLATGPVNGGFSSKSIGPAHIGLGHVPQHVSGGFGPGSAVSQPTVTGSATQPPVPVTVATSGAPAPVGTPSASTTSCSSRFRVIKLDHGTGEPFRRGRWTCTEFYERDSEGSSVGRTVDSIKPAVTLDQSTDRDSGLGTTGGSVVVPSTVSAQGQESTGDSGYSAAHHPRPQEPLQHGYGLAPQIGSGASAFQPTRFSTTTSQQPQQAQVNLQPAATQTPLPSGPNGVSQGAALQKSPIMPPATQAQQFAYSPHPPGLSSSQSDFRQQHFVPLQPQGSGTQSLPMASLSTGPAVNQGSPPVITPAGHGAQGLGMVTQGGEVPSARGLLLQVGSGSAGVPLLPGSGLQQPVSLPQPSGGVGIATAPSIPAATTHSGAQNVPATVPSANTPPGMPSQATGAGGYAQAPGASGGAEDSRQKSDALPQPGTGSLPGKDGVKPFIPESLGLPTPTVNSLFGIPIPIDGDEDSASGASVVAIDNKIEQAMDLVKSHLMYAVREEVEVLKEQIKELCERNSALERENAVLKSLANTEQLSQLSNQLSPAGSTSPPQPQTQPASNAATSTTINNPPTHHDQSTLHQPNISSV
ncbi:TSC22 domain family protein 2-like [Lampris incognitus]|uniref:TSC22 domain family protein 2-like n=1 Tax=Lampris incognitus TaxID=2546036 RepID=UPI0024B4959B|nr:TSC22 domain family protein 2-like [Lampris incognitus]